MKKKILLVALVLVALASTIGVGFASWVISRPAEKTLDGQFYVETVTDESLFLVVTPVGETTLSFYGPSEDGNDAQAWLQYQDEAAEGRVFENLGVVYKFELYRQTSESQGADYTTGTGDQTKYYVKVTNAYKLNIEFSEGTMGEEFTASLLANRISAAGEDDLLAGATFRTSTNNENPEAVNATLDNTNVTWSFQIQTSEDGVAFLNIDYAWGTHFGGNNPFTFYNAGHDADDTKAAVVNGDNVLYAETNYAADAEATLGAIYNAVNGISFQLHIKVSASDKVVD